MTDLCCMRAVIVDSEDLLSSYCKAVVNSFLKYKGRERYKSYTLILTTNIRDDLTMRNILKAPAELIS